MNYIAITAASVIYVVIGVLWYSPLLFSKKWMRLNKIEPKTMKNSGPGMYVMPMIPAVITATVMEWLLTMLGVTEWPGGAMVGLMSWFGFTASTQLLNWAFSGKKMGAFLLDTGYQFVSFILMGAFLAMWK